MRKHLFLTSAALVVGVTLVAAAFGLPHDDPTPSTWVEVQKLTAPDARAGQLFGAELAIGDDLVAIGTRPGFERPNKVYLFRRTLPASWQLATELTPSDSQPALNFGVSLALAGDRLVVGATATGDDAGGGRALVFDPMAPEGWGITAELAASEIGSPYAFGISVALGRDGRTVAVGAWGHVFVFVQDPQGAFQDPIDLPLEDGILPSDLLLEEDTLLVGAPDPGEIFVFERGADGTWSQQARFGQPRRRSDSFGSSIAANQDVLAVGAPREDSPGIDRGFVHLFARNDPGSWSEIARLVAPGLSESPFFGNAVAIAGDTLAVGMPYDEAEGAVQLYDLGDDDLGGRWTRLGASDAGDDRIGNDFGFALDLSDSVLVVGAPLDNGGCGGELGCYSGAVYVFERGPGPPLPDFLWEPLLPTMEEEVQFLDLTVGEATSYAWDFGDGGFSHEPSPLHVFAAPDLYLVSLTVANELGMRTARRWLEVLGSATQRCRLSPTTLCLHDGRFEVAVGWRDFDGNAGAGHVVAAASNDSGLFYFFAPENWEVLIKVLNGCPINGRYWVFFAATTNVELSVTVRDSDTDTVKTYTNPLGQPAVAVTDTSAFPTCP